MSNPRYIKGRRNEYKSMRLLEEQGWMCYRTAGSHTEWDIIALDYLTGEVLLVQVKTNKKPPIDTQKWCEYNSEWRVHLHLWKDRAKRPVVFDMRDGTEVEPW